MTFETYTDLLELYQSRILQTLFLIREGYGKGHLCKEGVGFFIKHEQNSHEFHQRVLKDILKGEEYVDET